MSKRYWQTVLLIALVNLGAGLVFAAGESLYSTAEVVTQQRQAVAFGLGCVSQLLAILLLERHKSWAVSMARVASAGFAAALVIGALRDGGNWLFGAGVESAMAGLVGWLGIEAIVAGMLQLIKKRGGVDLTGGDKP